MKIFPVFILCVVVNAFAFADPYKLYKEKDKIGLKDNDGKVVIPAAFDALGWSDGSFSVISGVTGYKLNDQWGLINLKKEFLSKAEYESINCYGGDRVVVRKKINSIRSATGCLDLKGDVKVPFVYDGLQIVGIRAIAFVKRTTNYDYGLIDLNGHEIIPLQYDAIRPLGTLRYAVENNRRKTALFSDDGKAVTGFTIDSISAFRSSVAIFYQDKKQGLIDRDGEIKVPAIYREIKIEANGDMLARMPDEWRVLSGDSKEIRKIEADCLIPMTKDLYQIVQGISHGVTAKDLKIILPAEYTFLGVLKDNKLVAAKNKKFGLIHLDGSIVLPFKFDTMVLEGRIARVRIDRLKVRSWSLYDTFGIQKTQREYDSLGAFNGQFYPALKKGYWGAVDRYGAASIQCVFDSLVQVFHDEIVVKFRGQYGIIDVSEKWIVPPQPSKLVLRTADRFSLAIGRNVFIRDLTGNDIYFSENKLEFYPDYILEMSNDGTEKRIDYDGRIIQRNMAPILEHSEKIFTESEGLRGIQKDGKFGFVDVRGRLRIANRYDGIGAFHEGLAAFKILGKWGYLDSNERIIIQPVYDAAREFSNGRALVSRNGKIGMIERNGKLILPAKYDSIQQLSDGNILVGSDERYGLAGKDGRLKIDTRYDELRDLNNGYCLIRREGKSGLITVDGISTIPLAYDQLILDCTKDQYLALMRSPWKKIAISR